MHGLHSALTKRYKFAVLTRTYLFMYFVRLFFAFVRSFSNPMYYSYIHRRNHECFGRCVFDMTTIILLEFPMIRPCPYLGIESNAYNK